MHIVDELLEKVRVLEAVVARQSDALARFSQAREERDRLRDRVQELDAENAEWAEKFAMRSKLEKDNLERAERAEEALAAMTSSCEVQQGKLQSLETAYELKGGRVEELEREVAELKKRDERVTRFEVIDYSGTGPKVGRVFTAYDVQIERAYQDGGRTLKVFVDARPTPIPPAV